MAEQLIRLRRYRGLSQAELARAIGTQQAAISRHESGANNITVKTLEAILQALHAIVRIDLIPDEMEHFRASFPRWWVDAADHALQQSEAFSASAEVQQATTWHLILSGAATADWNTTLSTPRAIPAPSED